jgi:hypothetical protein
MIAFLVSLDLNLFMLNINESILNLKLFHVYLIFFILFSRAMSFLLMCCVFDAISGMKTCLNALRSYSLSIIKTFIALGLIVLDSVFIGDFNSLLF